MGMLQNGQEIEAEVVAVTNDCIFLDLNEKSEGVLDRSELNDENGECSVQPGQKLRAYFIGERKGEMRFTTKISGEAAGKDMLENAWKNGIPVEGRVEKEIKGGYEVKIGSVRAFCPYSQMGFRQKEEASYFLGQTLIFKIQEYKENGKNILISNRVILEEKHKTQLKDLEQKLKVGATVNGKVVSLQKYGAFVDVDGFQALLPISEISRQRIDDVASVLQVGQEITAVIIKADLENEKVSLSMKSLQADPWNTVIEKYKVDSKYRGSIARVTDYGLFVTLEPGLDGLVHISELQGENRNLNLRVKFKVGQAIDVSVKAIDAENRRISLKPTSSNEQDNAAQKYMENQVDDGDTYNPFAALLKK
ncbi:MAG: S1 RNA-binding domain-containing protein [Spirochaetaceae bacterium]|nr:S1 RNA-binding domain-containing protein [Spirochaetaceae bacterium]